MESLVDGVPVSEYDSRSSVTASVAAKLSRMMKSESDSLLVRQLKSEEAAAVSSTCISSSSLAAQLIPSDVCSTVSVRHEPGLSSQDVIPAGESECGNWCRADNESSLPGGVQLKQEPSSPVCDAANDMSASSARCQLLSCSDKTAAVGEVSSQSIDTECTFGDDVTADDVNRECDSSLVAAAADDDDDDGDGDGDGDCDNDVNVASSQSLTHFTEAAHTAAVPSVCSSLSRSRSASAAVVSGTSVSMPMPQELIRCRDLSGKMYYVPLCRLLRQVHSSSAVNCTKLQTAHRLPSTCCALSAAPRMPVAPVTVSRSRISTSKCDVLPSVGASTSVVAVNYEAGATACSTMCTVPARLSVTAVSSSNVALSTAVCCTVPVGQLTTTAQSSPALSFSRHRSALTSPAAVSGQQLHQVCLNSVKLRDKIQVTPVPNSVLNNAVIKPHASLLLCSVNSPASSLPHITVQPSVVTTSRIVTPVSSVINMQRPVCRMTAKLPSSSTAPRCFVIGGNNKVVSGNSHALTEVVLVATTKDVTQKVSVPPGTAAGVNGRYISTLSSGVSHCSRAVRVCDRSTLSSSSSSLKSVVCKTSLNKTSKLSQPSRSCSQISVLRPQTAALSSMSTNLSSVLPQAQMKATSSSSSSNVFATRIGNQTVIVDIGNLSPAVRPAVSNVMYASSVKLDKSACSQQDMTLPCGKALLQSSARYVNSHSVTTTDEASQDSLPVIRCFINCFLSFKVAMCPVLCCGGHCPDAVSQCLAGVVDPVEIFLCP